jgi:hypothetical protein
MLLLLQMPQRANPALAIGALQAVLAGHLGAALVGSSSTSKPNREMQRHPKAFMQT